MRVLSKSVALINFTAQKSNIIELFPHVKRLKFNSSMEKKSAVLIGQPTLCSAATSNIASFNFKVKHNA